ncbi:HEPN domain-containing protein [Hymenobacter terrenus]|uniref:HEPN domain-containing protein n=1 Tax=Hymenobacter terrenus TaxID=1629124 RepID=UPI000B266379|nr:HEPN domain-containing protein [Hymenobacter terrenus]
MSSARQALYESISAFSYALESNDITSKDPIVDRKHNERARFLRNGLAVSGFAMVEEFVKERTGEILEKIGNGLTPFEELPEGLKTAAIEGVIDAMRFQSNFIDKAHVSAFYQHHSQLIASTMSNPFKISKIAFANSYTNLSSKEIEDVLVAFRIESPWNSLSGIVTRLGLGILAPKQAFENATKRRHTAAHRINTNTEYSELKAYKNESISFCLAYDLLVSKALKLISIKDQDYLKKKKLAGNQVQLRYLRQGSDSKWRELKENNSRALKVSIDFEDLKNDCLLRAKREGFSVVQSTELGVPVSWYTPELDF